MAQFPSGYISETVASGYNQPISIDFYGTDNMFVGERDGKVWLSTLINEVWIKKPTPIINLSSTGNNEIKPSGERGLQDIIYRHPHLYISYTVNEEFLFGEGSPIGATISRITRYEPVILYNLAVNREIIIGTDLQDGIPSLYLNHNSISMAFDNNGFMLVGVGDSSNALYYDDAVSKGIIEDEFDTLDGKYLAQTPNIENGKILRIVPWTGEGVSSNPYIDFNNRRSPISRLYSIGVRNPFRIDYNNRLYVATVGQNQKESIYIVDKAGLNNGWGKFEGMSTYDAFNDNKISPYDNATYSSLISQASSFEDHSDVLQRRYTHNVPELDYSRTNVDALTRVPSFNNNILQPLEYTENPIQGNSITGGVVLKEGFGNYTGGYIFSDYTRGWLNIAMPLTDNSGRFFGDIINFCDIQFSQVVKIKQHPDGSLYIVQLNGLIKKISYDSSTLGIDEFEFNYEDAEKEYWTIDGKKINNLDYVSNGIYIIRYYYENRTKVKKVIIR